MFLGYDTETLGLDENQHNILTLCFKAITPKLQVVETLNIKLRSETYHVTPRALEVNKINLIEHHNSADSKETATELINQFLERHYRGPKGARKLVPLGHNVMFDIRMIKAQLPGVHWDSYVDYHILDTMGIALFFQTIGKFRKGSVSLANITKDLSIEYNAHNAEGDVDACIEVLRHFMNLAR